MAATDEKRERIFEAAKRRFGRFGIRATTMQDIARDVGIAVGTIYQFFPDKDALVTAWVGEHRDLVKNQMAEVLAQPIPADEKLREFLRVRFQTVRQMREEPAIMDVTRAVLRLMPDEIPTMTAAIRQYLARILAEGRESGSLPSARPDRDVDVFFLAVSGFFTAITDPIAGPPTEEAMLRVVDWFIEQWKRPQ